MIFFRHSKGQTDNSKAYENFHFTFATQFKTKKLVGKNCIDAARTDMSQKFGEKDYL